VEQPSGVPSGRRMCGIMLHMRSYVPVPSPIVHSSNLQGQKNFSGGTVAFWHSTGSDPLTLTVAAVSASASSNGEDWHLGVLELPVSGQSDTTEDFYFSGVYIESGSLTTSVASPGGAAASGGSGASSSAVPTTLSTAVSVVSTPAAPSSTGGTLAKYTQCGGTGWTGSGTCVAGTICTVSSQYYSQCL